MLFKGFLLSKKGRGKRFVTAAIVLLTLPGLLNLAYSSSAAAAGKKDVVLPGAPANDRVKLGKARVHQPARNRATYPKFDPTARRALPKAGTATVTVGRSAVKSGPITLTGGRSGQVRVTTADEKTALAAGVHGVLFGLQGAGATTVTVDPADFRNAYGGDYAARLRLVRLPACALTTPSKPECQTRTPISSATAPLSAQVSLAGGAVLAADTTVSGPTGDYTATSLSPGGTWSTSGNTGAFTYSYPISAPPAIGGATPTIALTYNSASQDALTEGTNNQGSWLGDGWSSTENFVERTYKPCQDVSGSGAPKYDGDQCWAGQVLTMSLNGNSVPIVYDDSTHTFKPRDDNATTKVEYLTGATNGTVNGEYFKVTDNGLQYFFGLNRLPGWSSGKDETKSVYTMPVYKAHAGVSECSDSSTFAETACTLGYRFNLDYVVDPHSNAIAYYYTPETGYYGAVMKNNSVSYLRGGTLSRIDYGMTASTIFSGTAPEQMIFKTDDRCLSGDLCGTFSVEHPEYWPDTPIDLNCASGSSNCTIHGPSFWSRRRLASITTQIQVGGATKQVDRYDFTQTFPDGGDHAPTLWLAAIKHTGLDRLGGADAETAMPAVTFNPIQLANRIGTLAGLPRMYHNRILNVVSETGAEIDVTYSTPDCSSVVNTQAFAASNTTGCFPVFWTPEAQPDPLMDWFYTHPVTKIVTLDNNNHYQDGSQPKLVTEYAYKGDPGWHFDDNEVVKAKNRTWGQFRGYPEVDVSTGDPGVFHYTDKTKVYDRKTLTKSYYFLGMNGDTLPGNGTRSVPPLKSSDGAVSVADNNALAGQVFEAVTYTGDGGSIDSATVTVPTIIGPTATRARSGLSPLTAQMVRTAKTLTRQAVSYGWRKTEVDTFYNSGGVEVQRDDRGEVGAAGNVAHCTFIRYLSGATATLRVTAETIETDQDCSAANASVGGTLLSDTRTSFDGNPFAFDGDGQSNPKRPAKGDATTVRKATSAGSFITASTATYDGYGRVTASTRTPDSKAADGTTTLAQTVYTKRSPASGELPGAVTTITAVTPGVDCSTVVASSLDCQFSTVTSDPARALPLTSTDVAGKLTSQTYDALGRLAAVWLPNKSKVAGADPNATYSYALSQTGPTIVTTRTLLENGHYAVAETLSDALLRPLETQATGANGATMVSDTQYDSHGWTVITNNAYAIAGAPVTKLISDSLSQVSIPQTTVTDHDAMGRATQTTQEHNGVKSRMTRTAYAGDKTTVIPPTGGVAATTTKNARDQVTSLAQYTTWPTLSGSVTAGFAASGGTSQSIAYEYTPAGKQAKVTGPDQSVWSFGYDLLGRETSRTDPDTGTSFSKYDNAGNLIAAKDARGIELDYTYDLLGRKLAATDKSKNGFKYASWSYDTLQIGQPTSSTRYVNGVTGDYTVGFTGYSTLGKPLGKTISLPTVEQPLPVSYQTGYAYTPNTELLAQQTDPAVSGLPGEIIHYGYDALGQPASTTGIDQYVADTTYTDFGQPSRVVAGPSSNQAEALFSYDEETLRLESRKVYRSQGLGPLIDETSYTYDQTGNPLSTIDKQSENGSVVTDTQCYRYNTLARLTDAWTSTAACAAAPGAISSGAGSYWQTFEYDTVGDRTKLIDHPTNGGADVTTSYTNGCAAACNRTGAQPHTLTATTGGADPTTFVYDVSGNLLTRTPASGTGGQTLKWDDEGNLASVNTSSYLYDADGNQLIRRDPGKTTLYAGDTEVVIDTSVTPAVALGAVRTYSLGSNSCAVRSTLPGGGSHYLFNDPHGTSTLAMDTTTQAVSRKQYKPYGEDRSTENAATWPDPTHGYLGKSKDGATGYTDLGARKYDPALGRFISADPILETTDSNQMGGYTYSGDNPVGGSDPSGLLGSASCTGGMVGGPGACSGHEDPRYDGPPPGTYGGYLTSTPGTSPPDKDKHGNRRANPDRVRNSESDEDRVRLEKILARYGSNPKVCVLWIFCQTADGRPGPHEIAMCHKMGIDCKANMVAVEMAEQLAPEPEVCSNGKKNCNRAFDPVWNAKHHGYWMSIMVANGVDPDDARLVGLAHEMDGPRTKAPGWGSRDSRIDAYNNSVAIQIGIQARTRSLDAQRGRQDWDATTSVDGAQTAVNMVNNMMSSGGCGYGYCFSLQAR